MTGAGPKAVTAGQYEVILRMLVAVKCGSCQRTTTSEDAEDAEVQS
jgi:hypothetical protein